MACGKQVRRRARVFILLVRSSFFLLILFMSVQKLDPDERKEQERLDAKLATQIAFGGGDYGRPNGRRRGLMLHSGRVSPEAVEEEEEHLLEKFASNKQEVCKAGSQCDRSVEARGAGTGGGAQARRECTHDGSTGSFSLVIAIALCVSSSEWMRSILC